MAANLGPCNQKRSTAHMMVHTQGGALCVEISFTRTFLWKKNATDYLGPCNQKRSTTHMMVHTYTRWGGGTLFVE